MRCENCKIDKPDKDFINNQKLCFRCEYQEKLKKAAEKRVDLAPKQCRMCKSEIPHQEGLKKRQRTVFCSPECALQGHKLIAANYWTRNIFTYSRNTNHGL